MGGSLSMARYAQLVPAFNAFLIAADCSTVNRCAMACAQLGHESVGLRYSREIWGPTKTQLGYEGRRDLGNTQPGDGRRFSGVGWIQTTGRHNFTEVSRWAFGKGYVPTPTYFVDHPDQLGTDKYVWIGPTWYWTVARPQLNRLCDAGDLNGATRAINGGTNGLADRAARWNRCRAMGTALLPSAGSTSVPAPAAPPPPPPTHHLQGDDMPVITTPAPAADSPKWEWPTVRVPVAFEPGNKGYLKVDHAGRGGWIHVARWWSRDPSWSANRPLHYLTDHALGAAQGHAGSERFTGYGWVVPPIDARADMIELVLSAPDGATVQFWRTS
jgi:predicted chitinase